MSSATLIISEILGIGAILLAGLYIFFKYHIFNFWRKKGVFYLEPAFPTGNIFPVVMAKMSMGELFQKIYEVHKERRYMGVYTFFKPNLVVMDPNLIKEVLTKEFASFHDRGMFSNERTDPLSGNLFLLPGKKWRNLRVKLTPTFTSAKMKQMFNTLKETGTELSKYLKSHAQKNATVEIKDIFARFSTDVIMSTAFGMTCNSLENPDNVFRHWGKVVFGPKPFRNAVLAFAPQIFDFFSIPYTEKGVTRFFTTVFKHTVDYREANSIVRKDFLDLLLQLMKNGYVEADEIQDGTNDKKKADTSNKLTLQEATAQAYVFFLAGFETSSTAATFCLFELAQHQDIQDKVREEIRSVIKKHGELTYNAVTEMTYLHKVLSEALRKYPPVPMLNRICTKEIQLPTTNATIPEGITVTIPVLGLHMDPAIYPDPEKFDPERFSAENIAARHPYVYLPFGEGPRICIGLRFGLMQTKVALISSLLELKYKLAPDMPTPLIYDKGSFVLSPKNGVRLIMEPAN